MRRRPSVTVAGGHWKTHPQGSIEPLFKAVFPCGHHSTFWQQIPTKSWLGRKVVAAQDAPSNPPCPWWPLTFLFIPLGFQGCCRAGEGRGRLFSSQAELVWEPKSTLSRASRKLPAHPDLDLNSRGWLCWRAGEALGSSPGTTLPLKPQAPPLGVPEALPDSSLAPKSARVP